MKIIGLRIEKYIGKDISGHNCDFTYTDKMLDRHIICGILSDNRKVEITLWDEVGECGSGWCAASWGYMNLKFVDKFNGYTFKAIDNIVIDDMIENLDDIRNNVFSVDSDGGCNYYPSGGYNVNMDMFKETVRSKEKRPVWIFIGESNLGKSFLSSRIDDLQIFETDSCNWKLPESITTDVIVLGNKHSFELNEIKERIFEGSEIIVVSFTKSE